MEKIATATIKVNGIEFTARLTLEEAKKLEKSGAVSVSDDTGGWCDRIKVEFDLFD